MSERIAFLTGHLAQPRLEKVLAGMGETEFGWSVVNVGVKVAALMTEAIIARRLSRPVEATRVVIPGRCRADLARLSVEFGVPFERGPEELHDLPAYFGKGGRGLDLSRSDIRIFAEIVEAPMLGVDDILARARTMRTSGADVIDLGGLPDAPFPHLADAVGALAAEGIPTSVDSANPDELRIGARAGAQFLLSLDETTLDVAADRGFAFDFFERDSTLDCLRHCFVIVGDRERHRPAEHLLRVGLAQCPEEALFKAINNDPNVQPCHVLVGQQIELTAGAMQARYAKLSD